MKMPTPGEVINVRYRLEAVLGDGGFGTVFRALDLQTNALVAVKVLHPDHGDGYLPDTRRRFEREVSALVQLTNPHTVRLLGHGATTGGLFYMVFEFLPGHDLSDLLANGPLAPPLAEHILRQVLASLAEAHRAGLTHRDIKPANIRVVQTPEDPHFVKLMDFGIARSVARDRVAVTKTGQLIGTPRYMSPEQLREADLTAASDIYSLGVVVVEMLAGSAPLHDNNLGAQLVRLTDDHRFELPPLDPRLAAVVHGMTATPLHQRYRTVGQVLAALDGRPQTVVETSEDRTPITIIAGVLVLVAAAAVGLLTRGDDPPPPRPPEISQMEAPTIVQRSDASQGTKTVQDMSSRDMSASDLDAGRCEIAFRGKGVLEGLANDGVIHAYVPTDAEPSGGLPLVMVLNGRWDRPAPPDLDQWLEKSGLPQLADEKGFVVLMPEDVEQQFSEPWDEPEDVARLRRWVDVATNSLCIDASRVFVVGQNDSSFLNILLRCEDWVTAVAHNSSRKAPNGLTRCKDDPPPSIWITPRDTRRLPLEGGTNCSELPSIPGLDGVQNILRGTPSTKIRGGSVMSVDELRENLLRVHQCEGPARRTYRKSRHGECFEWTCAIPLRLCTHEGGEPWPGTTTIDPCGGEAPDFPVGEQIWEFFESVPPLQGE